MTGHAHDAALAVLFAGQFGDDRPIAVLRRQAADPSPASCHRFVNCSVMMRRVLGLARPIAAAAPTSGSPKSTDIGKLVYVSRPSASVVATPSGMLLSTASSRLCRPCSSDLRIRCCSDLGLAGARSLLDHAIPAHRRGPDAGTSRSSQLSTEGLVAT